MSRRRELVSLTFAAAGGLLVAADVLEMLVMRMPILHHGIEAIVIGLVMLAIVVLGRVTARHRRARGRFRAGHGRVK